MIWDSESLVHVGFNVDKIRNAEWTFGVNGVLSRPTQPGAERKSCMFCKEYRPEKIEKSRGK